MTETEIIPETIKIPSGNYIMGLPECPPNANFHWIWHSGKEMNIPEFWLGKFPVTNKQFKVFLEERAAPPPVFIDKFGFNMDDQPVVAVTYHEAKAYCDWLSKRTGKVFRLPTDREWEYAARARSKDTRYNWGNSLDPSKMCFGGQEYPPKVGSFSPNTFGLCDMLGTIWEWCDDLFEEVSDGLVAIQKWERYGPKGNRVLRGGSYMCTNIPMTWIAYCHEDPPELSHESIGFRIVSDTD